MFTADILSMAKGRYPGVDVRDSLCHAANVLSHHPQSVNLYVSPASGVYDDQRIPIVLPEGEDGELPLLSLSLAAAAGLERYSTRQLINTDSGLVKRVGQLAVKDACGNGTYNTTNLLYSGTFVVEYDLVEKNDEGKYYVYCEPSILEDMVSAKTEGRWGVPQIPPVSGHAFLDEVVSSTYETTNAMIAEEGPYVSSGRLAADIMVMMKLYEEETRRVESTCVDPAFRKVLAVCSGGIDEPLFRVAFITNAALMGLKAVFYPTALEPCTTEPDRVTVDSSELKRLLAVQMATLAHHMPNIVKTVEEVSKRWVSCLKIDVRGSANWNLPGHVKNEKSLPYHYARLRGPNGNVLEISNKKIVTSLGVVDTSKLSDWVRGFLDDFYRRSSYAAAIGHGVDTLDPSRWRREVLLGETGPELPFRNKSALMDPDFCLSGMCFHYLASGQGVLLTKRTDAENVSGADNIFADMTINEEPTDTTASKKIPAMPMAPVDFHADIISDYDNIVTSNMDRVLKLCDKFGMFLESRTLAPRFAMSVLKATKKSEKTAVLKSISRTTEANINFITYATKITYEKLAVFCLVQLVMRYAMKTSRMVLPRDNDSISVAMKNHIWTAIRFPDVWKLGHEESFDPPTDQSLEDLIEPSERANKPSSHEEDDVPERGANNKRQYDMIDMMLTTTSSTFATGADKKDTMFAWSMVTLAERFCALYNVASHPKMFYEQVTQGDDRLSFAGGLPAFEKLCENLLPELEIYIPERLHTRMTVCREAARGFEKAVEVNKNISNSKVCKVKLAELKMLNKLPMDGVDTLAKPVSCDDITTREGTLYAGSKTLEALGVLFEPLRKEVVEHKKERMDLVRMDNSEEIIADGGQDEIIITTDVAMDDFFHGVGDNRSFKYRAALCHRQEYVAVDVLRVLEKHMGRLLTVRMMNGKEKILKELRVRSRRMHDWVVPFSMPTDEIDDFLDLGIDKGTREEDACQCFGAYSGGYSDRRNNKECGCVKLLVIPPSIHLKNLITALRFNTMASERRYFSDVSSALGFVRSSEETTKKNIDLSVIEDRWGAMATYKCEGEFLKGAAECSGVYTNVMKADRELIDVIRPRMRVRKNIADANNAVADARSNAHTGFFAGVWGLSAEHDLETTTLGPAVRAPDGPTPVLKLGDVEKRIHGNRQSLASEAKNFFKENSEMSFYECFREMAECVNRTTVSRGRALVGCVISREDSSFFASLVRKYGSSVRPPGAKLWTLLDTVDSCFENSLPVDWKSVVPDWTNIILNLTEGAPNIDESGAVFEASRFLSVCARSFFGHSLDKTLDAEGWTRLLTDRKTWLGDLARAYEVAMADNDTRAIECFIDSSNFMTNNNMAAKLKLKRTEDEGERYSIWTSEEKTGRDGTVENDIEKRAEWLVAAEAGLADQLSFSFVLAAICLFRVLLGGDAVRDLAREEKKAMSEGKLVPLIQGLKITGKWCKAFVTASSDACACRCISEGRFSDLEKDPLFFYRFVAYTIGSVAANDVAFENISRRILDCFDFNGFDTSNWLLFIRHHFPAILMGRRARLLSRPLAFIKSLVGLASTSRKFKRRVDTMEESAFEERVCAVLARVSKLILVKSVDSDTVGKSDILECCILTDDDVTVSSMTAFYGTVGAEMESDKLDYSYTKASNACSNTQLAKMKKATRLLNPNVYFNDARCLTLSIDKDEELLIDPSRESAMFTADAEVGRGKTNNDRGSSSSTLKDAGGGRSVDGKSNDHPKRTASNSNSTCGAATRYNFIGCSDAAFEYDDESMEDDNEPPDHELMSKSMDLLKKIKTMLRLSDINDNVAQTIRKMKKFLLAQVPFTEHDYAKHGVKPIVVRAGVEALNRWNEAVKNKCDEIVKECKNLEGMGEEYDMSVISSADYGKSKNCSYISEVKSSKTSFSNTLAEASDGDDRTRPSSFSWISLDPKEKQGNAQKLNNIERVLGGARVKGCVLKDLIQFGANAGDTAEVRILAELFAGKVKDSYWAATMPVILDDPSRGDCAHQGGGVLGIGDHGGIKRWGKDSRATLLNAHRPVANLKINNKIKENVVMKHHSGLASLYKNLLGDERNTTKEENDEDDASVEAKKVTGDDKDVYVVLGNDASKKERYKCLYSLWHCNNGIHPKNQVEMLKKLLFKNMNELWVRVYDRHIAVLNSWGYLNANNANDLHFGFAHGLSHAEVTDKRPPLSLFHSRFLSEDQLHHLLEGIRPMRYLQERTTNGKAGTPSASGGDHYVAGGEISSTNEALMKSVYSREVLSSCLDPRGNFMTASVTNSASVLYTPGTRMVDFCRASSFDRSSEIYEDASVVGQEKELILRNFLSTSVEVIGAISDGVFFQGERASGSKATSVSGGRVLRPVCYDAVSLIASSEASQQQQVQSNAQQFATLQRQQQRGPLIEPPEPVVPRGSFGYFETANSNNVLSETNECALVNCHKARGLIMSLRAVMNRTVGKRYDGQVFDNRSMRYHAGLSKGCLLDDTIDLFSIHGQTKSTNNRRVENDLSLYAKCADHYCRADADRDYRVYFIDWAPVVCMMGIMPSARYNGHIKAILTPYDVRGGETNISATPTVRRIKDVSPYNRASIGNLDKKSTACFLANPCGAVRWMARRAPNIRVCLTNAGIAYVSRRIAQTERNLTFEDLIIRGDITSFKLASNDSCISVDNNRYFLIDGNYLVGGRIEERNLMTDIYTRCKMKAEKHAVYNSLFPPNVVSAFLSTAVEGTTHSQGLALIEHVSTMKNAEIASRNNKNFWSNVEADERMREDDEDGLVARSTTDARTTGVSSRAGPLTPPSVYINDEDYILLRMMYEIAKSAYYYVKVTRNSTEEECIHEMTNEKSIGTDTTKAALFAMTKCYRETVCQKTGMPRKHAVHLFRSLLNFGGFAGAVSSGDGEKSHHLLYTMNIVAMNMATKAIVMLVGPTGNNLKTTIVEVMKSCWLELVADLAIGALNSSGDSTSSTQANLAYVSGKKTILVIDEVGYQGNAQTPCSNKTSSNSDCASNNNNNKNNTNAKFADGKVDNTSSSARPTVVRDSSYGDINEIRASHGVSPSLDSAAVWEQINNSMTKSKMKICARECNSLIDARSRAHAGAVASTDTSATGTSGVKRRKRTQTGVEERLHTSRTPYTKSERLLNMRGTFTINAFSSTAMWWNCLTGTVLHKFDDKRTCFNMLTHDELPFSSSDFHGSPWLEEVDARQRSKRREKPGFYNDKQIQDALHACLGNYAASHVDVSPDTNASLVLLVADKNGAATSETGTGNSRVYQSAFPSDERQSDFSKVGHKTCKEVILDDTLLRWVVTSSIALDGQQLPVLSCLPSDERFAGLLKQIRDKSSRDAQLANHAVFLSDWRMTASNMLMKDNHLGGSGSGFLYAFHAVYSGGHGRLPPAKGACVASELETNGRMSENDLKLGPVLRKISPRTIEAHDAKSDRLSSIIFCGDIKDEIDEDLIINPGKQFDNELLRIVEKPSSRSFPKITTDGSCVLTADPKDCATVLEHMKKAIVDTMKLSNTGSFVARYTEQCKSAPTLDAQLDSLSRITSGRIFGDPANYVRVGSSMFNHNDNMTPKVKALYSALKKYRSDGRTTAVSAIASAVASKTDVNSAVTSHMYPGQFDSNMLKKIVSKHASSPMRGLHCKPVVTSITMTPIMTSNSYLFKFFVDTPLLRRMIIFPCNTQFMFSSQNEDVQDFLDVVDNGVKCVHSLLSLERESKWRRAAENDAVLERGGVYYNKASCWIRLWNEAVHHGLGDRRFINDLSDIAALLPAKALQMLVKNSVLENRDVTSMAKLEECGNTLMHMYTTITLASRSALASLSEITAVAKEQRREEHNMDTYERKNDKNDDDDDDDDDDEDIEDKGDEGNSIDSEGFMKPRPIIRSNRRTKGGVTRSIYARTPSAKNGSHGTLKHLQMCNVNPKSLNTMTMTVNRSRQGAWAVINTALNCVVFVDTPFVETTRLYGEGCNLRMFVPGKFGISPEIDLGWCIGLRMPNPDLGVKGYSCAGPTIGAGSAIMKQVCDAWGSHDIRNIMYSCHHLHMLFELVLQFTQPKRRLTSINNTKRKDEAGVGYVSILLVCQIYNEMVKKLRFPVFETSSSSSNRNKKQNTGPCAGTSSNDSASPMEIPMFMSMIVNKSLVALRSTTNLSNLNKKCAKSHTTLVKAITSCLGHELNPVYLCNSCKSLH